MYKILLAILLVSNVCMAQEIQVPKCTSYIPANDGSGGFLNNPFNSRETLKLVFPGRFTGLIKRVVVWSRVRNFKETLYNAQPNEYGNRERYYGKKDIKRYPKILRAAMFLSDKTVVCVKIPDSQVRVD
jgi:hypothetical protein